MSEDLASQLFRPFLPTWLRERIGTPELLPGSVTTCNATILYADLSGFTALTAAFSSLPDGAERLHEALNRCYTVLIEIIGAFGGDVAAIAGDALTAWWPGRVDIDLARRCGSAMLAATAALPPLLTPAGAFQLELRIGVSAGRVHVTLAGLPSHGVHLVISGPALLAAAAAERAGLPGRVEVAPPVPRVRRETSSVPAGDADAPLSWEQFLPLSFAERLRLNELIPEYRRCVPVFAAFEMPRRPEQLHPLVAQVQTVVMRWGGWLNEVEVGDKGAVFVLLFGAPTARGDDASRAVGCCLELRERGLIVRAGITLGILFVGAVGSRQRRVYTAQGDDMNLAAHLMQQAMPGQLLVSGRVRHDVMDRYATTAPRMLATKNGRASLPVALVAPSDGASGRPAALRRYLPDTATLVGHARERQAIAAAAAAVRAGQPLLLLVEGESGIGKSCLLQDLFVRWVEAGFAGISAECSSGGTPVAFGAWRPLLLDLCGIDEGVAPRLQLQQLNDALIAGPVHDPALLVLVAQLLGIGGARRYGVTAVDEVAELMLIDAFCAVVSRQVARGPLLILLEDLHWADEASLRLAHELLRRAPSGAAYPLLLALSHRPLDGAPPQALAALRASPATRRVLVGRFSSDEIATMIRTQLGVRSIHDTLHQHVERHTEGQPLFIKEYLRVLRQHGLVRIEDDSASLTRPYVTVQVSNSAQGIIQARVDRLDAVTRLTLKVAAVIGRSFALRLLSTIHPARSAPELLREQLDTLVALQIIDLELEDPERVYRFKFGITHEVAYISLLFGQRRQLHAAVANWYEGAYAQEIAAGAAAMAVFDVLIDHLGRAEERERQARYCRIAAEQAAVQFATAMALRFIDQALVVSGDPAERLELLLLRVIVNDRVGNYLGQREDLDTIERLCRADGQLRPLVYAQLFRLRYLIAIGLPSAALALVPALLLLLRRDSFGEHEAERREVTLLRAALRETTAHAHAAAGNVQAARSLYQHALVLCRLPEVMADKGRAVPLPDPRSIAARSCDGLARLELANGDRETARALGQQALELARSAGDWCVELRVREGLARILLATGELEATLSEAKTMLATSNAVGDRVGQAQALRLMAHVSADRGDYGAAGRDAHYALAIGAGAGARALEAELWDDVATYAAAQGQHEEAAAAHQEAQRARRPRLSVTTLVAAVGVA
jgi:class 3 adenylate cyclase/tetratricopeptide (TPR) repeat protein